MEEEEEGDDDDADGFFSLLLLPLLLPPTVCHPFPPSSSSSSSMVRGGVDGGGGACWRVDGWGVFFVSADKILSSGAAVVGSGLEVAMAGSWAPWLVAFWTMTRLPASVCGWRWLVLEGHHECIT